jgi:hypothetical protein
VLFRTGSLSWTLAFSCSFASDHSGRVLYVEIVAPLDNRLFARDAQREVMGQARAHSDWSHRAMWIGVNDPFTVMR